MQCVYILPTKKIIIDFQLSEHSFTLMKCFLKHPFAWMYLCTVHCKTLYAYFLPTDIPLTHPEQVPHTKEWSVFDLLRIFLHINRLSIVCLRCITDWRLSSKNVMNHPELWIPESGLHNAISFVRNCRLKWLQIQRQLLPINS